MRVSIARGFASLLLAWACLLALSSTAAIAGQGSGFSADASRIRQFFGLIDRHRPVEAVAMMGPEMTAGPSQRAAWIRQFSAIAFITVRAIQPSRLGDGGTCRTYRVTLNVQLVQSRNRSPIPDYGWGPNPNLRWITLCPGNGTSMHIASLATGP
jgi:hypothetical protein